MRSLVALATLIGVCGPARAAEPPSPKTPILILPIEGPASVTGSFEGELARALRTRFGEGAVTTTSELKVTLSAERTRDVLGCTDVSCFADVLGALGGRWALGVVLIAGDPLSDVVVILRDLRDATRSFRIERRVVSLVSARMADLAADLVAGIAGAAGWHAAGSQISNRAAAASPPEASAQGAGSTLRLASVPPGARLALDGNDVGPAPASLTGLASGRYEVSASLMGYQIRQAAVDLGTGTRRDLILELDRLRDWQVGAVLGYQTQAMRLSKSDAETRDGTFDLVGAGAWYQREIVGPIQVGAYLGYAQVRISDERASDVLATRHSLQVALHASAGTGYSLRQAKGISLSDTGGGSDTWELALFSIRLRPALIYSSPSYLHAGLGVELGFFSCLHVDLGYAYLLAHPEIPVPSGYGVESISAHGFSARLLLGWSFFYPEPELDI